MNKKILAFFFLPIFLITLGFPSIKNSFKNERLFENEEFQIFSSYFNYHTLDYGGAKYSNEDMTSLITTGIYNGDISQIDSITFSYYIKTKLDTGYHNVSFDLDKNNFKIKQIKEDTYFYVELPIYYNYSTRLEFLQYNIDYFILNPTLIINNFDGTSQKTTYEQDYEIKPGWTIIDNGDQSYPKVVDAKKNSKYRITVTYSDGKGFNFYNYSSFSLFHHVEYYGMYDTNNENLLFESDYKLTPIGGATEIKNMSEEGLYKQNFKISSDEIDINSDYTYKSLNDSVIMYINGDYQTTSFEYLWDEKTFFYVPSVNEDNIESYDIVTFENGDNLYLVFDISLKNINSLTIESYINFTKNIKMGFNWNINLNVDNPNGDSYKKVGTKYIEYKAQEVSEINSSLLETPGLYYQDSDIVQTSDSTADYRYYLVLPDENDWDYRANESYADKMVFNDFDVSFPNDLEYKEKSGYQYYYHQTPDYEIPDFVINK